MHHASRVGEVNFLDLASYTWMITMVTMTLMTLVTLMTLMTLTLMMAMNHRHKVGFMEPASQPRLS